MSLQGYYKLEEASGTGAIKAVFVFDSDMTMKEKTIFKQEKT